MQDIKSVFSIERPLAGNKMEKPPEKWVELNENSVVQQIEHRMMQFDYRLLVRCAEMVTNESEQKLFIEILQRNIIRIFNIINDKYTSILTRILNIDQHLNLNKIQLVGIINGITRDFQELVNMARINVSGIEEILEKLGFEKQNSQSYRILREKMESEVKSLKDFDDIVYRISKLKLKVQGTHALRGKRGDDAVKTGVFIRKTSKYWVHMDNVAILKASIIKHLPLYVYNDGKGTPFSAWNYEKHDSSITSIYFDNEDFDLYTGRLKKTQGAEAIRIRWYGEKEPSVVFVEQKRHEQGWTGATSVKSRFKISERDVVSFINGKDVWESVKALNGNDVRSLYREIRRKMVERRLRPVLRIFYRRYAFQQVNNSKIRMSLDTDLIMIREDVARENCAPDENAVGTENAAPRASKQGKFRQWKSSGSEYLWPFSELPRSKIVKFPHAIFELKIQGNPEDIPKWAKSIVSSGQMENVHKFSKYIHGCSVLYPQIQSIPYWLPQTNWNIKRENLQGYLSGNGFYDTACPNKIFVPKQMEPKLYFANERVFLRWIRFGIFLSGSGLMMLSSPKIAIRYWGGILMALAALFSIYGLFLHTWRKRRIAEGENELYCDFVGPSILISIYLFIMGICVFLKFFIRR